MAPELQVATCIGPIHPRSCPSAARLLACASEASAQSAQPASAAAPEHHITQAIMQSAEHGVEVDAAPRTRRLDVRVRRPDVARPAALEVVRVPALQSDRKTRSGEQLPVTTSGAGRWQGGLVGRQGRHLSLAPCARAFTHVLAEIFWQRRALGQVITGRPQGPMGS